MWMEYLSNDAMYRLLMAEVFVDRQYWFRVRQYQYCRTVSILSNSIAFIYVVLLKNKWKWFGYFEFPTKFVNGHHYTNIWMRKAFCVMYDNSYSTATTNTTAAPPVGAPYTLRSHPLLPCFHPHFFLLPHPSQLPHPTDFHSQAFPLLLRWSQRIREKRVQRHHHGKSVSGTVAWPVNGSPYPRLASHWPADSQSQPTTNPFTMSTTRHARLITLLFSEQKSKQTKKSETDRDQSDHGQEKVDWRLPQRLAHPGGGGLPQ